MVILRFCSSGSKSRVEVPSSTLPSLSMALALKRMASERVVFPAPPCAMTVMFRFLSRGMSKPASLLEVHFPGSIFFKMSWPLLPEKAGYGPPQDYAEELVYRVRPVEPRYYGLAPEAE